MLPHIRYILNRTMTYDSYEQYYQKRTKRYLHYNSFRMIASRFIVKSV